MLTNYGALSFTYRGCPWFRRAETALNLRKLKDCLLISHYRHPSKRSPGYTSTKCFLRCDHSGPSQKGNHRTSSTYPKLPPFVGQKEHKTRTKINWPSSQQRSLTKVHHGSVSQEQDHVGTFPEELCMVKVGYLFCSLFTCRSVLSEPLPTIISLCMIHQSRLGSPMHTTHQWEVFCFLGLCGFEWGVSKVTLWYSFYTQI